VRNFYALYDALYDTGDSGESVEFSVCLTFCRNETGFDEVLECTIEPAEDLVQVTCVGRKSNDGCR
jgi:hypothetical protein